MSTLDFTVSGEAAIGGQNIEVQEVANLVPPAVEEAAMLYSNNQASEACAPLEAAIRTAGLGNYEKRAWGMLFDLYQSLGKREAHEALALEYAAKFETSPPTWNAVGAGGKDAAVAGGRAVVSLSGGLGAKTQEPMKQLLKLAEKNPQVRLDVTKVTDADDEGATLVLDALRVIKKAGKESVLAGADRLAAILAQKIETGRRDAESLWLLLLELYQQLGQQEAFDDTAVNYAITFEVSPPSWETPKPKAKAKSPAAAAAAAAAPVAPPPTEGFVLEGEISSAGAGIFAALTAYAEAHDPVVIDCRLLVRMDFVSAAQLLNLLGNLQAAGTKVILQNVSHLVAALWEVLGVDRVAILETRKN